MGEATNGLATYVPCYGYTLVEKSQLKMADATAYPAFVGNVAVMDTRGTDDGLDFWQPPIA